MIYISKRSIATEPHNPGTMFAKQVHSKKNLKKYLKKNKVIIEEFSNELAQS